MLTKENNELLTRVGPGTAMGNYFRRFWLPFLFSWELEPDGPPLRVRLLGEDLVAFRDSQGRLGLIQESCPHRRASLYFGRNEASGLACIYHGWKFDVDGRCVDMPSEPDESNFKSKVRVTHYPCEERNGVIWTYMGPRDEPAPLMPQLEWMGLPPEHCVASKRVQYSNWLQGLEGEIDQSHLSFTHRLLEEDKGQNFSGSLVNRIRATDTHPKFEVAETEYGVCIGSGRKAPDDQRYWRVTQFLVPSHIMTGPYGEDPLRNWRAWVPIDDHDVLVIGMNFHPLKPIEGELRQRLATRAAVWNISEKNRAPRSSRWFGAWHPGLGLENDFGQDRELQKTYIFSGIQEFWAQDAAPQVSMGVVCDRTQEHLGTSDLGIISVRRKLLNEANALYMDAFPPQATRNPEWYMVRSDAIIIPAGMPWFDATAERRRAVPELNPACP